MKPVRSRDPEPAPPAGGPRHDDPPAPARGPHTGAPTTPVDPPSASATFRSWRPGDEVEITRVMAECYAMEWKEEAVSHWRWKHGSRPGFEPEDALIVQCDGRVVACFHGWSLPLRIEEGVTIPASINGDWAVLRDFRGGLLTMEAWDRSVEIDRSRGALVRVGFATADVNESFYRKRFGSVFMPMSTVRFRKPLGLAPLASKVRELGGRACSRPFVRNSLERRPWTVDFRIGRLPPFHVTFRSEGFHLREGPAEAAHLQVTGPFSLISAIPEGPRVLFPRALGHLLTGKLSIRGVIRSAARLPGALLGGLRKATLPGADG